MRLNQVRTDDIRSLWAGAERTIRDSEYLEDAAQALVSALYDQFQDSVSLARIFVTVPFGALPEDNKVFVQKLCARSGVEAEVRQDTPVLSLIGSRGVEPRWNDRRDSEEHVGIPLVSSKFVNSIPMISRLLKELGLPLDWVDSQDAEVVKDALGSSTGLFFVENAADAVDGQGRKIITSRAFVSEYAIRSVVGIGGAYFGGAVVVAILFCTDEIDRRAARHFMALTNFFKSKTGSLIAPSKIFAPR